MTVTATATATATMSSRKSPSCLGQSISLVRFAIDNRITAAIDYMRLGSEGPWMCGRWMMDGGWWRRTMGEWWMVGGWMAGVDAECWMLGGGWRVDDGWMDGPSTTDRASE